MTSNAATEDKAIVLGHPSYVWRFGQDRRLAMVRAYVPLEDKRILDIGCGIGAYVAKFREFTQQVYGIDVERARVLKGSKGLPNLSVARGEDLPYKDNTFDVIFLNEVLEHVEDDAKVVEEALRVTRDGGHIVIYVPNRLYFFETHGFYLGKRYVFGLLPFINWFPDPIRRIFVPHVRAYLWGDLKRLFRDLPAVAVVHTYVYPGFDNIASRRPWLAGILRRVLYFLEKTPLRVFGLSHFLVLRKEAHQRMAGG